MEENSGPDPLSMHSLLTELNDLLSTTYRLNVSDMSYKTKLYVRVPRTSSNRSFQNSKEWVDTAIQIAGSKQAGTYEAAYWIANHLLRFYRDSVHQWGMQQRRCFRTVQNPLVCAMSREKASFRYTHPDVLAQVEATDEGNKRKLSEINEVDILSIKRKMQRKEGRIKAL